MARAHTSCLQIEPCSCSQVHACHHRRTACRGGASRVKRASVGRCEGGASAGRGTLAWRIARPAVRQKTGTRGRAGPAGAGRATRERGCRAPFRLRGGAQRSARGMRGIPTGGTGTGTLGTGGSGGSGRATGCNVRLKSSPGGRLQILHETSRTAP